ncbi:MAG: DNA-3-methyladenine glycosylase [Thermoprotei archaeon]|nr:MAG: DNA-3-methyladenine glycosylase [Thermoprotei archaeon]
MGRYRPLPRVFYERPSVVVARELLGKLLVKEEGGALLVGVIVEAEAYGGPEDPASHAARGRTKYNWPLWREPGLAYVYRIYGVHFCLNVVAAERRGLGSAVLIRAVESVEGVEVMRARRGVNDPRLLTSGPARLTEAYGIDLSFNGWDLTEGRVLYIARGADVPDSRVAASTRVGVTKAREAPWRFYVRDSPYVSRR